MIKVAIFDGDGTLGLPNPSDEIRTMLAQLKRLNIQTAVASNGSEVAIRRSITNAGLDMPAYFATKGSVGLSKPSPEFVHTIQGMAGVQLNEIVYVGDDDKTDALCAINAHVLPLTAQYSTAMKPREYGLPIAEPKALADYLRTYGQQNSPYFGWTFSKRCLDTKTTIDIRALIGQHAALTDKLKTVLKEQKDVKIGKTTFQAILFHYLVSQCYLGGLIQNIDLIIAYPGHLAGTTNDILSKYSGTLARTFKDRPMTDLLVRHTDAPESKRQGTQRSIIDQFNTLLVNPLYKDKIVDKRVLVLDDFTTAGYSLETARRMLLQAGAASVTGLAVAKYRAVHAVTRIKRAWNPFVPNTFSAKDIAVTDESGTFNPKADNHFYKVILPAYHG